MALFIPGIPKSTLPPVQIGDDLWDANSWAELQRRIERSQSDEGRVISDEEFVQAIALSSDQLIRETGLSDEDIERDFGMSREELANALGLPRDDERMSA